MLVIFKTLLPLLSGFLTGLVKSHIEAKAEQQKLLLQRAGFKEKSKHRAENIKDKKVAWTRRTLALMFSFTLLAIISTLVLAGIFNPDIVLNVPQESLTHTLFSKIGLSSPITENGYIQLKGSVLILPLLETLIIITETIIGFYFGAKAK